MVSEAGRSKKEKLNVTPITVTHPEQVDIDQVRLFRAPPWVLRLTIEDDRSYLKVKVVRAAPLSNPDRYICFLDGKDEEICMVDDLAVLDEEARTIIKEELDRRYLTSTIETIDSVRSEFGTSYWNVVTNRGEREFVVQNAAENAQCVVLAVTGAIKEAQGDLLIAGPCFQAGRYGTAAGAVCAAVQDELGIPAITAMASENPGVDLYRE